MILVIDASVAVKWTLEEPGRDEALRMLDLGAELWAPDLIYAEVANVFRKKIKANRSTPDQANHALEGLRATLSRTAPSAELFAEALAVAIELDHSVYDCFYMSMALPGGRLISADEVFVKKCKAAGYSSSVSSISDLPAVPRPAVAASGLTTDIIRLGNLVEQTFDHLRKAATRTGGMTLFIASSDLAPAFDSPAYRGLIKLIRAAKPSELADLVALSWVGRSYQNVEDWNSLREWAGRMVEEGPNRHERYFASLMSGVARGLEKLALANQQANMPSSSTDGL